jgi:hypothetical protein
MDHRDVYRMDRDRILRTCEVLTNTGCTDGTHDYVDGDLRNEMEQHSTNLLRVEWQRIKPGPWNEHQEHHSADDQKMLD